jgi:gliding motility-associated-like protein
MKNWLTIGLFLSHFLLIGQNLVPNSGFDELTDCPTAFSQIYLAVPWLSASNSTPDVLNECSSSQSSLLKIPNAGRWIDSYQLTRSRDGFAAIEVYTNVNLSNGNSEYIETPLIAPLEKGKAYYIEFYVSPDVTPISYWGFTDAVGLALSDTFYYKNLGPTEALPLKPVIENRNAVISDTAGWTRISGCHTAKGGEKYAIIGNFRNTQETKVEFVNPTYPFNSYFYIEDVLIQAFNPLPDTLLLCIGESKTLNAAFLDAAAYRWNTGSTDSTIMVQQPGLYTVEAMMEKCVLRDTVRVIGIEETGAFPTDTAICQGEPLLLTAPVIGNYQWSDGSKSMQIEIKASGNYALTVTNECGQFNYAADASIKDCGCSIYVPNVFSPDGDGWNDELEMFVGCDYPFRMLRFSIFDRWGNNLYVTTEGTNVRWNGTYKEKRVPHGVYVWLMEYEIIRNGTAERFVKSGDISILK